jgi:hypothetical protein
MNRMTSPGSLLGRPAGATARGVYRVRNGWGDQHSACVRYNDGTHLEMAEDIYRTRGHQPPFDDLPWKDKALPREA